MLALPLAIAAVVCGCVALGQINAQPERHSGKEMAIAGLILGVIGLLGGGAMTVMGFAPQLLKRLGYV